MANNMNFPFKFKNRITYDPAIPLLGIYSQKAKPLTRKDICTLLFSTALFTIPKIRKQPKHALIDEWIKKVWSVCLYVCMCDGLPRSLSGKVSACQYSRCNFDPLMGWSLERKTATQSSMLAWEIPWTEEPSRLPFLDLQKSGTWCSHLTKTSMWGQGWNQGHYTFSLNKLKKILYYILECC